MCKNNSHEEAFATHAFDASLSQTSYRANVLSARKSFSGKHIT